MKADEFVTKIKFITPAQVWARNLLERLGSDIFRNDVRVIFRCITESIKLNRPVKIPIIIRTAALANRDYFWSPSFM